MTTSGTTLESELDALHGWLDDDEQYHQDKAVRSRQNKATVVHTQRLLRQWRLETAAAASEDGPTHFGVSPSAITACPTIREAMAVIACGSNGYLRYRTAARVIMDAGLSKSKNLSHLARDLHERLKQDQDWVWDSPGVFEYLPYTRKSEARPGKPVDVVPVSTAHIAPSRRFGGGHSAVDPS